MTFPATDMWLGYMLLRFFTKGCEFHTALKYSRDRSSNGSIQAQMLTRVGARNIRDTAGLAKIRRPILTSRFEQATFFHVPATEIITIKMRALGASRGFHI